ncbi:aldehyde dehydrogenase EutE [Bacillus tamaricis]|uniref:Aldehyde dehydrogenase EutE n=1 Tax=Evansella tamaricis TaxID=2069301 RepID=A0ABS6JPI6_9BACI|nr:aldehyde dehydrogenase EutE [Evansella tamaricis]
MNLTEKDIQTIIESVMKNVESAIGPAPPGHSEGNTNSVIPIKLKEITEKDSVSTACSTSKQQNRTPSPKVNASTNSNPVFNTGMETFGVFEKIELAIEAGYMAQLDYVKRFELKDRERIIQAIREGVMTEAKELARLVYEETGIGSYQDKIAKHELAALKTPGTEDLSTAAFSGDNGLTIVEQAPFGLIGAVTPVTNPTETIVNNVISMLAAGNSVVFNVHPSSKQSCARVITIINKAIQGAGGPANLVTMVKNPTLETMQKLIDSSMVKLLVGTGGPGLVKTLLKSGKKAIGAGAGNPPVIVDDTADIEHAAKSIIEGASFDNNLLCIAEKEVFVLDSAADDLIFHLLNNGAYMLDRHQLNEVMNFALVENKEQVAAGCSDDPKRKYHISKKWIGKDATQFLTELKAKPKGNVKLLICEVDADHPFVQLEQMMPILPIVRVRDLDEAIQQAVRAEHGNKHTAMMHSKNIDHLTKFARAIETTIFVKNASSLAGVGFGGEGHTTMTIAGPTGEGITSAKTFTRQRRCVLADGGFRIIG